MLSAANQKKYYKAFIEKDSYYEGIFYVGVKSTGIFCRPTCSARKPKFINCEFFTTAQAALLAAFRPCQRCQPLSHPNEVSPLIRTLVQAIEAEPDKRWKISDLEKFSIDVSTAQRQFKKRFGMTFIAYARARRMGLAMKQIKAGESVITAQLTVGYESSSGFREAFSRIIGAAPSKITADTILKAAWFDTPLGPMIAVGDEKSLYLLEFVDRRGLEREVEQLRLKTKSAIIPGMTAPITMIQKELQDYFAGELQQFQTPIILLGSEFQKTVWCELQRIAYGSTKSYGEIAKILGKKTAFRAVARANGTNQLAIIIPCHRVVNSNGELAGYSGGVARKQWLLEHEKKLIPSPAVREKGLTFPRPLVGEG